ncbi:MAG: type II toxin-antitoxin system RelE/ParE family toxin [Nitrospiria bacterium]
MPPTQIVFFSDQNKCPVLDWLDTLPKKVQAKAHVRIERLAEMGYKLRRPEADLLRDGIYELRWRFQSVNYRILYFFHGRTTAVLSNGLTKEGQVPVKEIDLAIERKRKFETNPDRYTYREE